MESKSLIRDSYIGGIGNASFIPDNAGYHPNQLVTNEEEPASERDVIKKQPISAAWNSFESKKAGNQTDEDKIIQLTCSDDVKVTNINKTEEYNVGYVGLSILPWEEFVFNPRVFNELFYVESNNRITYDPDEVNTFFHGKNVMPPSVGDISENGKSWNIVVDNIADLKKVRTWLTERCSIFGVTLLYKEKRFGKPERAPCLVMMDPNKGTIGDKLYTSITRAMDSLHNRRRFCIEININGCVERWCKRVLMTDCKVVGGKLVITNGEEYLAMNDIEDKICCVVCFPIWLLQTGIYKLHRKVVYDDYKVTFDADDLFLHGAFQDARCQRRQIFTVAQNQDQSVFRTRSAGQTDMKTLQDLGSFKFVCVKRYNRPDGNEPLDESYIDRVAEHNTTTFGELVEKRKEKVLIKEKKLKSKEKGKREKYDNEHNSDKVESGSGSTKETHNVSQPETFVKESVFQNDSEDDDDQSVDNEPSLSIPVVASILCDDDDDSYKEAPGTDRSGGGSLFSPGAHHNLVPKDDFTHVSKSFETSGIQKGALSDDVVTFKTDDTNQDSETESDTESSVSFASNTKTEKDDLLNEMLKIEKSLPVIRKESLHGAKDVRDLTVEEKRNSLKKKKSKDKPGVKKALKDLMKTTKGKHEPLPSTEDKRFKEASSKIKQEKLTNSIDKSIQKLDENNSETSFAKSGKSETSEQNNETEDEDFKEVPMKPLDTSKPKVNKELKTSKQPKPEDISSSEDEVVEFVAPKEDDNENKNTKGINEASNYNPTSVSQVSSLKNRGGDSRVETIISPFPPTDEDRRNLRSSPEGGNEDKIDTLKDNPISDDSSTDGDEVEMIYQAPNKSDRNRNKNAALFLHQDVDDFGFIEKVGKKSYSSNAPMQNMEDNNHTFSNQENSDNVTDGEKFQLGTNASRNTDNPHRNEMFQKTNKASRSRNKSKISNEERPVRPVVTKSLDVDMEVTDFDQDSEETNVPVVVKSVDTRINTKTGSGLGGSKKSKRGLRQSSTRKYLGAAVPPKHNKGK